MAEWVDLCFLLRDTFLGDSRDSWRWLGDKDGEFSVGSLKRQMDSNMDFSNRFVWEWSKWVPLKCNLFAWRAEMGKIATRVELRKRNIPIPSLSCPFCASADETTDHLFSACSFVSVIWTKVSSWSRTPFLVAFSFRDIIEAHRYCGLSGKGKVAYQRLVLIVCWKAWKARNDLIFSEKAPVVDEVFSEIRSLGYLWFKNRSKYKDISWDEWCKFVNM
ncbi:uncharacterized protein LOC110913509 [Helianthus annuus]|uniref:uncharacterized protein LOC110913509 n=1 Tax=Helianthus annuus TaxID=4232 RepID=UPI000B902785|nr:uncharacterized protein LOC110913509 [Helianthus annuus]